MEKCLIYLLTCNKYRKQYVGQTIDTFRYRWKNYRSKLYGNYCCYLGVRDCYCANNRTLCIYAILTFLYLVSFSKLLLFFKVFLFIYSGICLLRVGRGDTEASCVMYFWLTVDTPQWRHLCCPGVFTVDFGPVSHLALVVLLLTQGR